MIGFNNSDQSTFQIDSYPSESDINEEAAILRDMEEWDIYDVEAKNSAFADIVNEELIIEF